MQNTRLEKGETSYLCDSHGNNFTAPESVPIAEELSNTAIQGGFQSLEAAS